MAFRAYALRLIWNFLKKENTSDDKDDIRPYGPSLRGTLFWMPMKCLGSNEHSAANRGVVPWASSLLVSQHGSRLYFLTCQKSDVFVCVFLPFYLASKLR